MDNKNFFIIIIALIFTFAFFPQTAFALHYRIDVNNGTFSQYNSGLASYENDTAQDTYNRSFEDANFDNRYPATETSVVCGAGWCSFGADGEVNVSRTTDYAHEGTYSAYIHTLNHTTQLWSQTEMTGDANVGFWGMSGNIHNDMTYGYVDDSNKYVSIGSIANGVSDFVWRHYSFVIPAGKYRLAFQGTGGSIVNFYLDDITITRNNAGTFRTSTPSLCSSISSCSNITFNFPASELGNLYWMVDYVAGASCTWSKDGVSQGAMTEGANGMYYALINKSAGSNNSVDANLSASCSKIPYVTKTFYASPRLYRYGMIGNGGFETGTITLFSTAPNTAYCSNEWCAKQNTNGEYLVSNNAFIQPTLNWTSPVRTKDGQKSLYVRSGNWQTTVWNEEYDGGATIGFWINVNNTGGAINYGYVNDSNAFTTVGTVTQTLNVWQQITYSIPAGSYRPAFQSNTNGDFWLDQVTSSLNKQYSALTVSNTLTGNSGIRGQLYTFASAYIDQSGNAITGATCTIQIGSNTYSATYNSSTGKYEYQYGFIADGTYTVTHACSSTLYNSKTATPYSVYISTNANSTISVNTINNVTLISNSTGIATLSVINNSNDAIFSITALSNLPYGVTLRNSDKSSRQYFVYTSTDGNNWTFSDTLTFGATTSTPIQKIWDANNQRYDYNFSATGSTGVTTYYKLVYQSPAYYSESINSSPAWFNQNPPTNYVDSSGKEYDIFSDSNYSNVQSYTIDPYQNLVSGDLSVGYELQFTAYGTSAGTLAIGSRVGSTDTTSNISVTTTAKRFSVPIAPSSRDAVLLIKSTSATSNTYYITDYAIVPRSYFYNQLEVVNPDNTPLQAILRNNTSQKYVMEGQAVKIKTSAYDISGNLSKIEIQTYLGGTLVKDQFIPITSYAGNYITFNQGIEGVIDLNGIGGELVTSNALRSITYKAILWNTSNQSVSEQYATVSVLQFPYFPNDFKLLADVLNVKLGTNPKLRVSIQDSVPSNFLGLTFAFFDSSHTIAIPNYSETIYAKDLGCTSLTSCTKEFNFDKYVWENTGSYTVQVTALINTENKNYTDSYTNVTKHIEVSEAGYLQVQMIQYMERHQNAPYHTPYNSTEKIPLMLGITDDTGKDLTNTISPYFTLVVNDVNMVTKYFPEASMYDETSGTTIWAWNQYFYDDSGNLLTQDSNVQIKGVLVDKRQTQSTITDFGFANRCVRYPFDIVGDFAGDFADTWNGFIGSDILNFKIKKDSNGWLSYGVNLWGSVGSTLLANGCVEYPPMVIRAEDSNKLMITIDDTFDLSAHNDNRQALYCGQKYDNNSVVDQMGDDFGCVLFVHEDLQQIDYIHVQIGNNNSDYSVTNDNKQYLDFTITGNDLMFSNTADLLRGWSQKGYFGASPTNSPSVQEVLLNAWHDIFTPSMTNEEIMSQYQFQELIGGNKNFNVLSDFNANVYNKVIFFKVKGLSTINAYDYLSASEQATFNNKNFLSYSKTKGFPVYSKDLQILLYSNSTESPFKVIETSSPIVINKAPSTKQWVKTADGNMVLTNVQEILPFHVISTMSYGNSTTNDRLIANLQFKQIIKANPVNTANDNPVSAISKGVSDILFGKDSKGNPTGVFNAPLVFITNPVNITIIFLILGFALIFTLMLRNVEGFFGKK